MPTATYEELLVETLPARIDTEEHYGKTTARFSELMARTRRSASESRLMGLLAVLIKDYDQRNAMPPADIAPADLLKFLMDEAGLIPPDLLPVFGQRSHVNEALNGKRKISLAQARKLADLFSVKPAVFI